MSKKRRPFVAGAKRKARRERDERRKDFPLQPEYLQINTLDDAIAVIHRLADELDALREHTQFEND